MTESEVRSLFEGLDDVDVIVGSEELGTPEAGIGDTFCSCAPDDGRGPDKMPFATIVTHDVPGWDEQSDLDRQGAFRVNLNVGRDNVPTAGEHVDYAERDRVLPHPQYATQGWISIVEPGLATEGDVVSLLHLAYQRARARRRG